MKLLFQPIGMILGAALMTALACPNPEPGSETTELPQRITFDVSSGTWMTVDVSPDGQHLLFDLLGNVYQVPIGGGKAKQLTSGWAFHRAPSYSPDGTQFLMVRDGDGPDEVWTMPVGGGAPRRITDHSRQALGWVRGGPTWASDGKSIVYGIDSNGYTANLRQIDLRDGSVTAFEPDPPRGDRRTGVLSPDGRWLFLTERIDNSPDKINAGGPISLMTIVRIDVAAKRRTVLTDTSADSHEYTPQLSGDGRWLGYIRRDSIGRSSLRVRQLDAAGDPVPGSDRRLIDLPDDDSPYRFDPTDSRPGYSFTPDDRFLVIGAGGRIHRVTIADGKDEIIPFTATVDREVSPRATPRPTLGDGPVTPREIQWPRLTPDGKTLVFAAVGYLWSQALSGGPPRRLTTASDGEFEAMPAISPDGKTVAYAAVERRGTMPTPARLMTVPLAGGKGTVVYGDSAPSLMPSWSPDGTKLAFVSATTPTIDGPWRPASYSFSWVAVSGGPATTVMSGRFRNSLRGFADLYDCAVRFSKDGKSLWYTSQSGDDGFTWYEIGLEGGTPRKLAAAGARADGLLPSPDGRRVLVAGGDWELWLIGMPIGGAPLETGFDDPRLERITSTGADYASWHNDTTVIYAVGGKIYRHVVGSNGPVLIHTVQVRYPRHQGEGVTAFLNGRIVTMSGDRGAGKVFEKGTLVVRGRRIEAVGPADAVKVPAGAKIVDATGLTLLPALADVHWHPDWGQEIGNLDSPNAPAYGVTTVWVPGPPSWNRGFLPIDELREAGRISGPRWSNGGPVINMISGGEPEARLLSSYPDVLRFVRHHADHGIVVMKEYLTRRRDYRRWFARAARETGLGVVSHTQGIEEVLKDAIDGYTGVDHVPFAVPVYDDLRQFLAKTGLTWTPNFMVSGWGIERSGGEQHFFKRAVVGRWPDQRDKWRRYYSREPFDTLYAGESVVLGRPSRVAAAAAYLMAGGAKVAVSYHNPPGLLTHGEMWLMQEGGAPPAEALRAATMNGIEKIGFARDLGSLEVGKIADFLVVRGNPLENVIDALAQKYVVEDGVVYEVEQGVEK